MKLPQAVADYLLGQGHFIVVVAAVVVVVVVNEQTTLDYLTLLWYLPRCPVLTNMLVFVFVKYSKYSSIYTYLGDH